MVIRRNGERPRPERIVVVAEQAGGRSSRLHGVEAFVSLAGYLHIQPSGSSRELPDTGRAGAGKGSVFERRFDQRQERDFKRNTFLIEDLLKCFDVTA